MKSGSFMNVWFVESRNWIVIHETRILNSYSVDENDFIRSFFMQSSSCRKYVSLSRLLMCSFSKHKECGLVVFIDLLDISMLVLKLSFLLKLFFKIDSKLLCYTFLVYNFRFSRYGNHFVLMNYKPPHCFCLVSVQEYSN